MIFSPLIDQLIEALRCLPGVGPKSAQRMAFYLLERNRHQALQLAKSLEQAVDKIQHCKQCRNLSETDLCQICNNPRRDASLLCVVETPADVLAVEQTGSFRGLYFVLMGHLSPIDGIGPNEIGIDDLQQLLRNSDFQEIILATNPTVEGEATAHFIADIAKSLKIKASRIAHGVPLGSELEFVDGGTLARALSGREQLV